MILPVVWTSAAVADLAEARAWYERMRPDLGERFARAVDVAVTAIAENPRRYPVLHRGRRRAVVRQFPSGLFFEIEAHRIVVIACFHGRRNPGRWQAR